MKLRGHGKRKQTTYTNNRTHAPTAKRGKKKKTVEAPAAQNEPEEISNDDVLNEFLEATREDGTESTERLTKHHKKQLSLIKEVTDTLKADPRKSKRSMMSYVCQFLSNNTIYSKQI